MSKIPVLLILALLLPACSGLAPMPTASEVPQVEIPYVTKETVIPILIKKMQAKQYDVRSVENDLIVFRKGGSLQTNTLYSNQKFTETELRVAYQISEQRGKVGIRGESFNVTNGGSVFEQVSNKNEWYVVQQMKEVLTSVRKSLAQN